MIGVKTKAAKKEKDIYEELQRSRIALIEDETNRRVQQLRLERDLELARIRTQYKDTEKRAELLKNVEEKFNREIYAISKVNAESRIGVSAQMNQKLVKIELDKEDTMEAIRKRELEREKKFYQQIGKGIDFAESRAQARTQRRIQRIDEEIAARQQQANLYKQLAAQGNQDAEKSAAVEQKNIDKLQLKRERALRRQQRTEVLLSGLKSYTAKLEQGDPNALLSTVTDMSTLMALLGQLNPFYHGTEDTGNGKGPLKDKYGTITGYTHANEGVLKKEHNEMRKGVSNEQLATLGKLYREGKIQTVDAESAHMQTNLMANLDLNIVAQGLEDVVNAVKEIPVPKQDYDVVGKIIKDKLKMGNTTKVTLRKNRGLNA